MNPKPSKLLGLPGVECSALLGRRSISATHRCIDIIFEVLKISFRPMALRLDLGRHIGDGFFSRGIAGFKCSQFDKIGRVGAPPQTRYSPTENKDDDASNGYNPLEDCLQCGNRLGGIPCTT